MMVAGCALALPVKNALALALRETQASAVVVDLQTGSLLTSAGVPRRGAPGSVIKPLLLEYALEHGIVRADMEVYCRRNLHVGARAVPCTHPADEPVFTAESALAESCNTWFAEMARRLSGAELEAALEGMGLQHAVMNAADVEQRQLAVLGLAGVSVSPLELARAYRAMLQRMPSDGPVARGLEGSVRYGMANPATVPGLTILGKTGTASEPGVGMDTRVVCRSNPRTIPDRGLRAAWRRGNGGPAGAAVLSRGFAGRAGTVRRRARCALGVALLVAGLRGVAAAGGDGGGRDVSVALFSARSLHGVTATPIGLDAWVARCAQCKHEPFVKSLHVAGEMDVFFGGMLRIADDATGDTRTALGLWHLRANGIDHQIDVVLTLPSEHYVAAVLNAEAAAGEPASRCAHWRFLHGRMR